LTNDQSPTTIDQMKPLFTAHLLPIVDGHLIELLRGLTPSEWELQTVAPAWKVKDVAAHLLDTQLRKLSIVRDGHMAGPPPRFTSNDEFLAFINQLNRDGVAIYRRLSPEVLVAMMEMGSHQSAEFHQSLDPMAEAVFSVSWAGEERSMNWFDTARELTERWHHQQQIRLATNRPGIMTRNLYYPVLDCFMRALPFKYRDRAGETGTFLRFNVAGECGGSWYLYRERDRWVQMEEPRGRQVAETTIPQEIAWRIFTKGIDRESALAQTSITGDRDLGSHVMSMVAIVG
jgi:uncharacterized protein (TIGR03083 family)